jgi:Ca-activated chloride channel family protein
MNIGFDPIIFAGSSYWYLGILVFVGLVLLVWNYYKRYKAINRLVSRQNRNTIISGYSLWRQITKFLLLATATVLLFIVLLRPQWGKIEETVEIEGRDLLIALDVSRSMLAEDLKPNRLEVAKRKIRELASQLKSERIALMLFAGDPVIQCPFTTDYAAFNLFLDTIDAQTISQGTTALDRALAKAIEQFEAMPERKSKLLVIFTDGEDFSSSLAEIKKRVAQLNLHIFTIGVGTSEGAPVPVVDAQGRMTRHQKDTKGNVVISQLNEGILKALAADSGGIYYTGTANDAEINALVSEVERYEREKFDHETVSQLQERYVWFALLAFICLLIEWLL